MSALSAIQHSIASELASLNDMIAQTLSSPNQLMNMIVDNYLKTKGKQIRPILVILSAKLMGEVNDNTISAAASVELLHNASLIHDDIVDETKTRRGEPTVNGLWDNHIAVLVGDFFVSSSLQRALDTADLRVVDCVARLGKMLSIGELDQIYCARFHHLSEEAYFRTIERKTASLFVSCVEMGAYTVNAPASRIADIAEFARLLGLCFQIKDDIFDYYSDNKIGKPTGNDLREGKITLPLLSVLLREDAPDREVMLELTRKEELTADEINRLIDYAKANGGIDYAVDIMRKLRDRAVALLTSKFPPSATRDSLVAVVDYTISRES